MPTSLLLFSSLASHHVVLHYIFSESTETGLFLPPFSGAFFRPPKTEACDCLSICPDCLSICPDCVTRRSRLSDQTVQTVRPDCPDCPSRLSVNQSRLSERIKAKSNLSPLSITDKLVADQRFRKRIVHRRLRLILMISLVTEAHVVT